MLNGNRLRALRLAMDKTVDEVGAVVGVSGAMVRHIENETRTASANTLKHLADYYGVTVDSLFKGSNTA